jgi:hypothetical protein
MAYTETELALIVTTLNRLRTQRLPRALDIKKKVDAGGTLDEFDIAFFNEIFQDSSFRRATVDTHPEFQDIVARITHLYHEITERALANEQVKSSDPKNLGST